MSDGATKTYEMLWDCKYCGTKKLLGKTHRFCPNCGAAQDPNSRYFPSDEEKVAVEDHVFVGKDKTCPSCSTLNAGNAQFCGQCGAPLDKAVQAATLDDQVRAEEETFESSGSRDLSQERFEREMDRVGLKEDGKTPVKSGPPWLPIALLGAAALVCVAVLAVIFWRQETSAYVSAHSWERAIHVETFSPVPQSAWCDSMPFDAYGVSRSREVRSYNQIPDGEECSVRRVDNGDGTFSERQECRTTYRDEPVYDDKCYFTVNRWIFGRSINASGGSLADKPYWPNTTNLRQGVCLGCEREGTRSEAYRVTLKEGDKTYTCEVNQQTWQNMPIESTWAFDVGVITGVPDCGSLRPPGS